MFAKPEVAVGHRFVKVGTFMNAVWRVARIIDRNAEVPHANLQREGADYDFITVSLHALADANLFRRLSD